jgi:hypothetical protein
LQVLAMAAVAPAIWAMLVAGRLVGVPGDFHGSILRSPEHAEARREARARLTRLGLCG